MKNIDKKLDELVEHVTKLNPEMGGMPMCPFARIGLDKGEVEFIKEGKNTLVFALKYIKDMPKGKTLVVCATDAKDFTQKQLEDFCEEWQDFAIERAYICIRGTQMILMVRLLDYHTAILT